MDNRANQANTGALPLPLCHKTRKYHIAFSPHKEKRISVWGIPVTRHCFFLHQTPKTVNFKGIKRGDIYRGDSSADDWATGFWARQHKKNSTTSSSQPSAALSPKSYTRTSEHNSKNDFVPKFCFIWVCSILHLFTRPVWIDHIQSDSKWQKEGSSYGA